VAKKRNTDKMLQQTLEIGQRNKDLMPKIRNWCRHLEIKMESAGLVAEIYNVPAGTMSMSCAHASAGGTMSMYLSQVAADFITSNCRDCPHHEMVSLDNIGREILNKEVEVRSRRVAKAEQENSAKLRLHELVSGDLTEALRREDITKRSVLELVLLLDDDSHSRDAAMKLVKAATVAAEFFTKDGIEVICSHFPDINHGQICMDALMQLGAKSGELPEIAFLAARACLEQMKNCNGACYLIGTYLQERGRSAERELVEAVLNAQWHGPAIFLTRTAPRSDGSEFALKVIAQKDVALVVDVLKRRLKATRKDVRFNAAHIVEALLDDFPGLAQCLVDPLIDSLELDDDIANGVSADGAACRVLAAIYVRHPDSTQERLDGGYRRLSEEGKEIILQTYRCIALAVRASSSLGQESVPAFEACISRIIGPLLGVVSGSAHPIDARVAASEVLKLIARHNSQALKEYFDGLLGALANLVQESVLLDQKSVTGTLEGLEKRGSQATYSKAISHVLDAINAVAVRNPQLALGRLKEIFANLDSSQPYLASYKAELIAVYGQLGRDPKILPEVIPELYKPFVDFGSALVRGAAVQAVGKILEKNPDALPQNMAELLAVYLSDSYVYVHKSAVKAVQHLEPSSREEINRIVVSLLALDQYYDKEPYFRRDVLAALLHITRKDEHLRSAVTVPVIVKHSEMTDEYIAQDALTDFRRLLPRLPESLKIVFARLVLSFLGRTRRDSFNNEAFTERYQLFLALFDLPQEAIAKSLSQLLEAARAMAKLDPWDSLRLVQLLSYFEMYDEAAGLAAEIQAAHEPTRRNEDTIREACILGNMARAELLIGSGMTDEALKLLREASALEAQQYADLTAGDPRDFISTLTVANEISDGIE
jgi:hypothetical protein